MEVTYTRLVDFITGEKVFAIPVYQRNYDWKIEHCRQLFDDVKRIIDNNISHFLGTIVYQKKNISSVDKYTVIDGQQRITSVILFAKALYDTARDDKIKSKIRATFIDSPNDDSDFKLQTSEYDRAVFEKLMTDAILMDSEKSSRLYENYEFFKRNISNLEYEPSKLRDAINQLKIVAMGLSDENPQEIFESLNTTGKDLTETEKIRNYLLMDLDDDVQDRLYKEYWLPMERLFNSSEIVDKFVLQYLTAKRKSSKDMQRGKNIQISTNAMYETFKKYFKQNYGEDNKAQHVEEFLENLLFNAKFCRRLIFTNADNFDELSELDKKFYELVYLLDAASAPIILIYLNERYTRGDFDATTFIQIVDALISLNCRAKVCQRTGIDSAQNAANIINRLDKFPSVSANFVWHVVTQGKGKYTVPCDEDFRQALMSPELNLSLKSFCKYLLYSFERNQNPKYSFADYGDLSVELVIPKKLTAAWENYLRDRHDTSAGILSNALGNLVLVNSTNKSAAFAEKRKIYAESEFNYTKDLSRFSDWTSRNVRRRTEILANLAPKIWVLPSKYQPAVAFNRNNFTLDDEPINFTNKNLATVSISDSERPVNYWIDFLRIVVKELYALDEETFRQAVQNSDRGNIFSTSAKNLYSPFKIDENYYLGGGIDTKTCLRTIKAIVENFDSLSGTNFRDEIWFTIKDDNAGS